MKTIQVILICPYTQTITQQAIEPSLLGIREAIGPECVLLENAASVNGDFLTTDEEGLQRNTAFFELKNDTETRIVPGRAVLIGVDAFGTETHCKTTASGIAPRVRFLTTAEANVYLDCLHKLV